MALQVQEACDPSAYTGPADYGKLCADIDADCKAKCDALAAAHKANVDELKAECAKQTRILEGKEDDHADEKADRKEEDMDVSEAKKAVAEKAHCRPELFAAKEDLAGEEAIPNDASANIDAECKAKKRVMKAEQCVEVLERAEAVLDKQKDQHSEESKEEDQAASKVPPQEERKRIACAAVDGAAAAAPPCNCGGQGKKDALLSQADEYIESLLAEYLRQKKILEGKVDDHADEKADVDAQEKVVSAERKDVKEAKIVVARDAHCPPELEAAKAALAKQEAIPNETPGDIDAECEAKKAVLEAQACVDRLRKAEQVLGTQRDQHGAEKSDLHGEATEEDAAAAKLPPQEKIVCDLKAALDAAREARKSLPCGSDQEKSEPEPEKEKKSGAARTGVTFTVLAALLCALVQA
jgi:hypothetical protein